MAELPLGEFGQAPPFIFSHIDVGLKQRDHGDGEMNQEGKEVSRVYLIPGQAQKKNLTSFSIDAESMRGPLRPKLPSCSENSMTPDTWLEESSSSP
jgi:hypothetical protein